jgi:hypothetical protein
MDALAYDATADKQSWEATRAFLRTALGG